jgi:ABC-type uncharacterized transport system ATPase component
MLSKMASVENVPSSSSRSFGTNYNEGSEKKCQTCFKVMEQLEVLKSETQSAQLINKILQDELNRTGRVYSIAENLSTYETLKSQSETCPISESETPDKKSKNPKKIAGKKNSAS